ncbi:MAG TPA: sulfatase, partial [Verrucomicrobiales bacterium]|nr:sulfatase [Verrucomicrobiales bacterium]
ARSTLITGCYATSLGTQRLRSTFALPGRIKGFPEFLRNAGWFTSNNVKTDYNIANEAEFITATWDRNSAQAHWRQREGGQPFFSVFNLMTTHQSRANVWSWEEFEKEIGGRLRPELRHDPANAPVWPFYPDTPTVRRTIARYYDCITLMDQQVGALLRQLDEDGLADDTIVFFYSDHGMGMPRGKRLLHDSGLHVPLMIRFPEKWSHLAPAKAGETTDRLVSFVDFAPTVLSLLELEIPDYMQGLAFLGPRQRPARQFVYGARDRVDEAFDVARSIRDGRYLLIRNYQRHLPWMQPERYSDNAEMRRELKQLAAAKQLNGDAAVYAAAPRPAIEFYDTQNDPHQVHNLADDPAHAQRIRRMSNALARWQRESIDLGFFTEPDLLARLGSRTPWEFGEQDVEQLSDRVQRAGATAAGGNAAAVMRLLEDGDPAVRYWGVIGLRTSALDESAKNALRRAVGDDSAVVRIEAAAALAYIGETEKNLSLLARELRAPTVEVRLHAMRAIELLGLKAAPVRDEIARIQAEAIRRLDEHPCWLFVQFSAEAALENLASAR